MKTNCKQIAVIGAGEVGITFTIIMCELARSGLIHDDFSITLIDNSGDILSGATNVANINHESGFEYLKKGHQQTGIDCIQGGITKRLFFNTAPLETGIENRFLISTDTIEQGIATYKDFEENVSIMKNIYNEAYHYVTNARKDHPSLATPLLVSPDKFGVKLSLNEIPELKHIAGGYRASGGSIKMAYAYAIKKSLIEKCIEENRACLMLNNKVKSIEKNTQAYRIKTSSGEIHADLVVICAGHQNPYMTLKVEDGMPAPAGMYHLNGMLYLKLEANEDKELLNMMSQVNFVLQGDGGCMYACCLKPTETSNGYAAVYYPSEKGNQIEKYYYDPANPACPPFHWDEWIKYGLPSQLEEEKLENIFRQLFRFNPYLEDQVSKLNFVVRTVFNPVVTANENGKDRRVRELIGVRPITKDHKILTATSPKWTNVELTALSVINKVTQQLWNIDLPKHEHGFGPEKIDVELLTRKLYFSGANYSKDIVHNYQKNLKLPSFRESSSMIQFV